MLRRAFMVLLGCLALTLTPASAAPATQSPEDFVLEVSNNILEAIRKDAKLQQGQKAAVEKLVDEQMMPAVDFLRMTRMAVGPKWREAFSVKRSFRCILARSAWLKTKKFVCCLADKMTARKPLSEPL